ncbi:MAG: TonB-dependent receptor plug domain-containing protein, partial [Steroidobacteraceae bacterium]
GAERELFTGDGCKLFTSSVTQTKGDYMSKPSYIVFALAAVCGSAGNVPRATHAEGIELEEIVVSARRREESLQEVPVAVTALSANVLEQARVTRQDDLTFVAPGLSVNKQGGGFAYTMRGQGQLGPTITAGVQAYFDEIPLSSNFGTYFDISRIEVLRGPQGTLFGRNTNGGAVRQIPRRPSLSESGGYLQVAGGDWSYQLLEGGFDLALVQDKLGVRVAANTTERDGFVKNRTTGDRHEGLGNDSVRLGVLARPWEKFENYTVVNYFDSRDDGIGFMLSSVPPGPLGALFASTYALQNANDYLDTSTDFPQVTDVETLAVENIATFNVSDALTFKYILGYVKSDFLQVSDADGSPFPLLKGEQDAQTEQLSHEIQLQGSAFGGNVEWITGGYFERQNPDPTRSVFNQGVPPTFALSVPSYTFTRFKSQTDSVFAQTTIKLSSLMDGLSFVVGGRYNWDDRKIRQGVAPTEAAAQVRFDDQPTRNHGKFDGESWTVGLNWQATSDLLLYVASRHGFKAGGLNQPLISLSCLAGTGTATVPCVPSGVPDAFDPEEITDVELGAKLLWNPGPSVATLFNIALYDGKIDDAQRLGVVQLGNVQPTPGAPTSTQIPGYNAGDIDTRGVEVEASANFFRQFTLGITYAYTDAEFDDYRFSNGTVPADAPTVPYTPKNKYTITGRYQFPFPENIGEVALGVSFYHQGKQVLNEPSHTDPFFTQIDSVELLNGFIEWNNLLGQPLDLSVFVRNADDERYFNGSVNRTFRLVSIGEPRTWGAQLRYRFGGDAK